MSHAQVSASYIEILNGAHDPPHPFMVVDRRGLHVDMTNVGGELWDAPTVRKITWGLRDRTGKLFGTVELVNGTSRNFWNGDLMTPYLHAYKAARAVLDGY
jgi:hypothetical protein